MRDNLVSSIIQYQFRTNINIIWKSIFICIFLKRVLCHYCQLSLIIRFVFKIPLNFIRIFKATGIDEREGHIVILI